MPTMTRRQLLHTAGAGAAALALSPLAAWAAQNTGPFTLPKLPYPYDALEPSIDATTMRIHHDKHHQAYVDNLNAAVKGHPDLARMGIDELLHNLKKVPVAVRTAVRNNGGGHANHTMFWEIMGPRKGGRPNGELARAIDSTFGSFTEFQKKLKDAAMKRFGSGWAWLVVSGNKLAITSSPNQDTPVMEGRSPILGIDVWEHAYYLKYQNRRGDYIDAWWKVVDWDNVGKRFAKATKV